EAEQDVLGVEVALVVGQADLPRRPVGGLEIGPRALVHRAGVTAEGGLGRAGQRGGDAVGVVGQLGRNGRNAGRHRAGACCRARARRGRRAGGGGGRGRTRRRGGRRSAGAAGVR